MITYNKDGRLKDSSATTQTQKVLEGARLAHKARKLNILFHCVWLPILIAGWFLPTSKVTSLGQVLAVFCLPTALATIMALKVYPARYPRPLPLSLFLCHNAASIWWGDGLGVIIKAKIMPLFAPYPLLSPLANLAPLSESLAAIFLCATLSFLLVTWMGQQIAKIEVSIMQLMSSRPT